MPHPTFPRLVSPEPSFSLQERVQLALAIADEHALRSLLSSCTPPVSTPQQVGSVRAAVGVPISDSDPAHGLITYEHICCVLSRSADELEYHLSQLGDRDSLHHRFERLTRYETETQTLGHGLSLAQAIATLTHAGFTPAQIETILTLPYDGCHKSWWYTLNDDGQVAMPFHRTLRTRRLSDGTFILQYKDHFAQDRPPCFESQAVSVLVELQAATDSFGTTLAHINQKRQRLNTQHVLLIGDRFSDIEARAYINQGISLVSAHDLRLPSVANCEHCIINECPMHHLKGSPVQTCDRFCPASSHHPN